MNLTVQELNRSYVLHGSGGITTVQTLLAGHGTCHFSFWEPCPPDWRVRFITYLNPEELRQLLEDVMMRYGIRLYQEVAVYAGHA
jgi:hypothetical protein